METLRRRGEEEDLRLISREAEKVGQLEAQRLLTQQVEELQARVQAAEAQQEQGGGGVLGLRGRF